MFIMPGVLVSNIEDLRKQVGFVRKQIKWLQLDVMDGKFVPERNLALADINVDDLTGLTVETHLMVANPLDYLEDCKRLKIKRLAVHYEVIHDKVEILQIIKSQGFQVTIVLNPGTTVSYLENVVEYLDGVLLMTVQPGEQGQSLMSEVLEKVTSIRIMSPDAIIGIDGGVKLDNLDDIKKYNLDYVVVGSGLWTAPDPAYELDKFKQKLA